MEIFTIASILKSLGLAILLYFIYVFGYSFFIKPYLRVKYFISKGGVGHFLYGAEYFNEAARDAKKYGNSMVPMVEALKKNPDIKFFVRNIGSQSLVILTDIELIKKFLQNQQDFELSRHFTETLKEFHGGLFFNNGEKWKQGRKLASSKFNFESLKEAVPIIRECTKETYKKWIKEGTFQQDAIGMFVELSGEVVLRYLFNVSQYSLQGKDGATIIKKLFEITKAHAVATDTLSRILLGAAFVDRGLLPAHKELVERKAEMVELCKRLIHLGQQNDLAKTTYLYTLLEAAKVPGSGVDENRIVGELYLFLLTGTESNAHTMGYTLYHLYKNPSVLEKLLKEINQKVPDLDNIDLDTLNHLDYVNAVVKETLRLMSVSPAIFARDVVKTHNFGDFTVQKGDLVTAYITINHLSEKYYTEPYKYIPERWLEDGPFPKDGWTKEPYAYWPFSLGPRNCIGQHLAMLEAKMMVIYFVKMFEFRFPEDYELKALFSTFTMPLEKLSVTLKPIDK